MSVQRRLLLPAAPLQSGKRAHDLYRRALISKFLILHSYPNVYGIDMPSRVELVAHGRTTEEVAEAIGADLVIFQTLQDLVASVRQFNSSITTFDCSVFTGNYVTGGVDTAYLDHIEQLRADNVKGKTICDKAVNGTVTPRHDIPESGRETEGSSGPVNGIDDTIGLYNSWKN